MTPLVQRQAAQFAADEVKHIERMADDGADFDRRRQAPGHPLQHDTCSSVDVEGNWCAGWLPRCSRRKAAQWRDAPTQLQHTTYAASFCGSPVENADF
ncbi:hypothetical protein [Sinorhizobium medicae]|uniref:hypothetical protein n=1 Tax=Sinorhizobium medicae TaxID=110321 RepID=UPI0015D26041